MKRLLLGWFFFCFAFFAYAQKGTSTISVGYGIGTGQVKPILERALKTPSLPIHTFDLNYHLGINKNGIFETGVMLLKHTHQVSNSDVVPAGLPMPTSYSEKTITALVLPFKLRFDVLKYFFVSGGPFIDVNISDGIKPSFGVGIGMGAQYYYRNRYGFFIHPQLNFHTLDIGLREKHISFGLAYRLTDYKFKK